MNDRYWYDVGWKAMDSACNALNQAARLAAKDMTTPERKSAFKKLLDAAERFIKLAERIVATEERSRA